MQDALQNHQTLDALEPLILDELPEPNKPDVNVDQLIQLVDVTPDYPNIATISGEH